MPAKDVVVEGATEHTVVVLPSGRRKYPFKRMLIGEWFSVFTLHDSRAVRHALRSFARRFPDRKFTVRQRLEDDDHWVCRRAV